MQVFRIVTIPSPPPRRVRISAVGLLTRVYFWTMPSCFLVSVALAPGFSEPCLPVMLLLIAGVGVVIALGYEWRLYRSRQLLINGEAVRATVVAHDGLLVRRITYQFQTRAGLTVRSGMLVHFYAAKRMFPKDAAIVVVYDRDDPKWVKPQRVLEYDIV